MTCEYCGRSNSDDGRGGCISCGALLKRPAADDWECGTTMGRPGGILKISRKQVSVSEFKPPDYTQQSWRAYTKRQDDDSPTFAPLASAFVAPVFNAPDTSFGSSDSFSGGGGDSGGGGASGDF